MNINGWRSVSRVARRGRGERSDAPRAYLPRPRGVQVFRWKDFFTARGGNVLTNYKMPADFYRINGLIEQVRLPRTHLLVVVVVATNTDWGLVTISMMLSAARARLEVRTPAACAAYLRRRKSIYWYSGALAL